MLTGVAVPDAIFSRWVQLLQLCCVMVSRAPVLALSPRSYFPGAVTTISASPQRAPARLALFSP